MNISKIDKSLVKYMFQQLRFIKRKWNNCYYILVIIPEHDILYKDDKILEILWILAQNNIVTSYSLEGDKELPSISEEESEKLHEKFGNERWSKGTWEYEIIINASKYEMFSKILSFEKHILCNQKIFEVVLESIKILNLEHILDLLKLDDDYRFDNCGYSLRAIFISSEQNIKSLLQCLYTIINIDTQHKINEVLTITKHIDYIPKWIAGSLLVSCNPIIKKYTNEEMILYNWQKLSYQKWTMLQKILKKFYETRDNIIAYDFKTYITEESMNNNAKKSAFNKSITRLNHKLKFIWLKMKSTQRNSGKYELIYNENK